MYKKKFRSKLWIFKDIEINCLCFKTENQNCELNTDQSFLYLEKQNFSAMKYVFSLALLSKLFMQARFRQIIIFSVNSIG